jgi:hypothetical protein
VHTSVCTRVSLEGILSPSFQFAPAAGDCSLVDALAWRNEPGKALTDLSDVAASWLVIWSAIGRGAAGCGAVRHTVDAVRVGGSYTRSTLRRQRGLFALVGQAVWGAQTGSGSRLRGRHEAGGSNAEEGSEGGAVCMWESAREWRRRFVPGLVVGLGRLLSRGTSQSA